MIQHHTKDIPNAGELEVIFATDDEGNEYKKVRFEPTLCQINDPSNPSLEVVGFYDDKDINKEDINAICIT